MKNSKKSNAIVAIVTIALMGSTYMYSQRDSQLTDVEMANVEALSGGEGSLPAIIPCIPKKGASCLIQVITADGNIGYTTLEDYTYKQ